jgi:hypothetical protein
VRADKPGQAGMDFSAFLSQAMQSKEWAGNSSQRQSLAELPANTTDRAAADSSDNPSATSTSNATSQRNALQNRQEASGQGNATSGTHQELTQRALRSASLRAAQSRADGSTNSRSSHGDIRSRKTSSRRDDDTHATATAGNSVALPPADAHRPIQDASGVHAQATTSDTSREQETTASTTPTSSASWLDSHLPVAQPSTVTTGAATGDLTTVQLSPHLNIITPGQGVVSEQSLQSFAQSMGIDAGQFKQLMTAAPAAPTAVAGSMDASGLRAGVTATDALTGTPLLNAAPTDLTAIDLSQAVPAGLVIEDLHIDWMGGKRSHSADLANLSTLEVLGLRDAGLGNDAVTSLQESADAGAQGQQPDNTNGGMGSTHLGANARTGAATANAPTAAAPQNMAEHFEKLSAKLATEMAGRIHEQFSQGEWKMKFALKPASLGQVDVQLEMRDGKLAAVLQADNPMTQDLLQNGSQRLRDALSQMGLSQSSVSVGDGRNQAFQGERQPGAHGSAFANAQHSDSPDDVAQAVNHAPRRDSLSQLDFYA